MDRDQEPLAPSPPAGRSAMAAVTSRRRRWRRLLDAILLVATIVTLALYGLLATSPGQRLVLAYVSGHLEETAGVRLEADAVQLHLLSGIVGLDGARLHVVDPEAPPFATIATFRARIRWPSLFGDRVEIPTVVARGVTLDLAAPRPETAANSEPATGGAALEVDRITVTELTVIGPVAGQGDTWLRRWSIGDGTITGAYRDGTLDADARAKVQIVAQWPERAGEDHWVGDLSIALSADDDTTVSIPTAEIVGEGLEISGSATARLGDPRPVAEAELTARVDIGRWWPAAGQIGTVAVDATTSLRNGRLEAVLEAQAEAVPGELLDPWLAEVGLAGVATAGTQLEAEADLQLAIDLDGERAETDLLRGEVVVAWSRNSERLLVAEIRADDPTAIDPAAAAELAVQAELRPDGRDVVRFTGNILVPAWTSLLEAEARDLEFQIEVADGRRFFTGLWSAPPDVAAWIPAGEIAAVGHVSGPVRAPFGDFALAWTNGNERILTATASRRDDEAVRPLRLNLELLPARPGVRRLDGVISLREPGVPIQATIDLTLPEGRVFADDLLATLPQLFPGQPAALGSLTEVGLPAFVRGPVEARLDLVGPWRRPTGEARIDWRPDPSQRAVLVASGPLGWEGPTVRTGTSAELTLTALDLADWIPAADGESPPAGRIDGTALLALDDGGQRSGTVDLELSALAISGSPWLEELRLSAALDGDEVTIDRLDARLALEGEALEGASLAGSGHLTLGRPPEAELTFSLDAPAAAIHETNLDLVLADGTATLRAQAKNREGETMMELPLGSLADLLGETGPIEWPPGLPRGPLRATLEGARIGPWSSLVLAGSGMSVTGEVSGRLEVDLARPFEASGEVIAHDLELVPAEGGHLVARQPVRVTLAEGRLELDEVELVGAAVDSGLVARASARLNDDWAPGDDPLDVVQDLTVDAEGTLEASILNPFLGGGLASGPLALSVHGTDRTGELELDVELDAPDGSLFFPISYITKIEAPTLVLRVRGGVVELERTEMLLNHGTVQLSGQLAGPDGASITIAFDDVRYRVDYGLNLILDGHLVYTKRPDAEGSIAGRVLVERGILRRDLFLDRELLRSFTAPTLTADEESAVDRTRLDIGVGTREGIRIDNNIAELRLDWSNLQVSGTIGEPVVSGRIDSDPGGWLEVIGQLYRVDNLTIELFEDPTIEPIFDAQTTSVLDDPTLYQQRREGVWYSGMNADSPQNDLFWREQQAGSQAAMASFTSGLATYFGDRLARTVGQGNTMQFSVQPLPLYGETSTDGRFTLSQRIGRYAAFIASSDTRQAEAQSYILESSELLPKTKLQVFTSDEKNQGATVQIVTPIFRANTAEQNEIPRLGSIEWELPETIKKRQIKRAVSFGKGDPFPSGSEFDVEIDVLEALQTLGYPGSTAEVAARTLENGRIGLLVSVTTGPHVEAAFEGIKIPLGFRELIEAAYLPSEIDRGASLEVVRTEAERTLRRLGHMRPHVVVTEEAIPGVPFKSERLLRIAAGAERTVTIQTIRFTGLPENAASSIAEEYESLLPRIELAEALPGADRLLARYLKSRGYEQAELVDRTLSAAGDELVVEIEPGPRQVIAGHEVVGLPPGQEELAELIVLPEGTPAQRAELTSAGRQIVRRLRDAGYPWADVALKLEAETAGDTQVLVRYTVDAGARFEIDAIAFEGLNYTDEDYLRSLLTVETGQPLRTDTVAETRRNLFRTTLFEAIETDLRAAGSTIDDETTTSVLGHETGGPVTALFKVEEGPRFLFSYGGRWEETKGASIITDLIDRNVRGRAQTLGLRAVLGESQRRLRLYYGLPRLPFENATTELFLEGAREDRAIDRCDLPIDLRPPECSSGGSPGTISFDLEELTARLQLTLPLTPHAQARPFLTFTRRRATPIDPPPDQATVNLNTIDGAISPVLGVQIAYDTRSQSLAGGLSEGAFLGLEAGGSHEAIGSDVTALEISTEAKYFMQVGTWRSAPVVWAQRARVGFQLTPGDSSFPIFDQYQAGGEYSLRGYPTESFGPGQVQIILNQELHFPIWSFVTGLVFFDTGNVWATIDEIGDPGPGCLSQCSTVLFSTLGFGLRASAFRLDFAVPLDPRLGDPDYQVYFGFGNAF